MTNKGRYSELRKLRKTAEIDSLINDTIIEISKICDNSNCKKVLTDRELMKLHIKNPDESSIKCPSCGQNFSPNLKIKTTYTKFTHSCPFYFPYSYIKEIEKLKKSQGINIFLCQKFYEEHSDLFWNTIYYFQLINKPFFMLSLKFDINVLPKLWKYQNSPVNENRRSHSKGNPLIPKRSDLNKTTFATEGVKRSKLSLKFPYENSAIGSEYKPTITPVRVINLSVKLSSSKKYSKYDLNFR